MLAMTAAEKQKKILVVDDDAEIREVLGGMLSQEGYSVAFSPDGAQALKRIKVDPPDLVLLDLNMPNMDGVAVCRMLRRDNSTRSLPIIMLTGKGEAPEQVEGLDSGADDYIVKPYDPDDVKARIAALLRRAR
jgi:DNA-binding response OmpR family regulator